MEESGSSGADGTGQGFICLCSISGDADRWMYGCTQLLPWNNVITPINSHVTLDPPAGPETRIPLPPLSLFTLSAHSGVDLQYHPSAMQETALQSLE